MELPAATGLAGLTTGAATATGAGAREMGLTLLEVEKLLPLPEPLTALDTVEDTRGEISETTWDTMSLELNRGAGGAAGARGRGGGGGGGVASTELGRLLAPLTALDTVEEMSGCTWLTTVDTMSLVFRELLLEDEKPLLLLLDEPLKKPLSEKLEPDEEPKPELEKPDEELPPLNEDPDPEKDEPELALLELGLSLIWTNPSLTSLVSE